MKKFVPFFFAVMLALAVMLLPVVPASANPSTLYVDDDYTASTPGWGVDHFATIQGAVNAASSDDTIIVYPGTYTENVDVDKSVTIQSQNGASGTTVDGSTTHNHTFNVTAHNVSITGFTLRGATATDKAGIYLDHVQSCNISANTCLNNYYGINLDNSSNNTLTSNISNSNTKDGIYLDGSEGSHGNILDGNTANQNGECGIYVDNSSNNTLTSNTANSNSNYGIHLDNSSNNTLTGNSVTGSNKGVKIEGYADASTISINFNKIYSNTQYGVENSSSGTADATNNWWGDSNGPSHTANPSVTGDAVSDNVSYDPWHLKQITDLTVGTATDSSIDLSWTTIGAWNGDYFDVRYSTSTITPGNWNSASRATGEPTPSTSTASQGLRMSGLSSGTTYYFGLRLIDGDIDSSDISNIASATTLTAATAPTDTTPPGAITDLAASLGTPPTTKVILTWTAKGDDGTSGIASKYIIKRSTSNITADNFDSATTVYNDLTPKANGDSESFNVSRLSSNTTYYFAIKIQDEVPNTSAISNVVSITTVNLLPTVTNISPTTADNGQARTLTITGTNFASSGTTVVRLISDDNTFEVTSVTYVSETQLTAMVPQGAPTGTYKARVINNNGTSALSLATYTVAAAPTPLPVVTNVIPQMGTNDAATSVKIVGENLTGASAVSLDDQGSTSLTGTISVSADGTEITGLSIPSGVTAGEYNVKVTTAAGTNGISAVKFKVSDPVVINSDATEDITTSEVVDLGDTNIIPVEITLTSDTSETATQAVDADVEIGVVIPPQTTVTTSEGNDYIGNINPPRVVKPDESILTGLAEDSIIIEMGNPEETIHFDQDFIATITLTSSTQPLIWYYNKTISSYELAGKTGTKDGVSYARGGTVLNQADTLYTIGLLLDHMSNYIVDVPPAITDAPESATAGTNITITGTNFDDEQAQVYFNGTQGTVVSRAVTQIAVTVPKFYGTESSTYTLKVENRDGLYDTTSITITPLPLVPTLTWWGTVAMIALFGSLLIFMLRRRLIHQL